MPRSIHHQLATGRLTSADCRVIICLWITSLMFPAVLGAQQGALAGVKVLPDNIRFVGNKSFSVEDLRAIFRSAGTVTAQVPSEFMDTYSNDRILHAINTLLTFYRNRGFVKASISPPEVEFGPSEPTGKMAFALKIIENNSYQLGQVRIAGATALREDVVISMLNLQARQAVNVSKINAGILALRETYLTLGYLDVDIKTSLDAPDGKKTADLKVDIFEGSQYRVGQVQLIGHSPIKENLLREILPFQPGDIFGRKAFDACLETLNELGITPVLTGNDVDFNYNKSKALVDVAIHLEGKKK
jgi:outer membrane protein insertion porin family